MQVVPDGVLSVSLAQAAPATAIPSNPDRDVFFGQTHSHTSWSMDAYIIGNMITGPAEAYQFSMGQPISHPGGYTVKLARPLDFQGVTDHSEYLGMVRQANDPNSPVSKAPIAAQLKVTDPSQAVKVFQFLVGLLVSGKPIKDFLDPTLMRTVWQDYVQIADKYYQPGKFTTFVSYEWTSQPGGENMHRNIFFRDSKRVPDVPFTALDSVHPEDLVGLDGRPAQIRATTLLAISHNGNLSNGRMFPVSTDSKGKPLTPAWAQERLANEPLTEIKQIKGTSETTPELSPNDEFADYELMSFLLGTDNSTSNPHGSYVREAYQNGLAMQVAQGYNPYKFGMIGASDSHDTSVAYTSKDFTGGHGNFDATPKERLSGKIQAGMEVLKTGTSGLAGVWAEQNTREFDLRRHASQGGLRNQRRAHQGAHVRRLGLYGDGLRSARLGQDRLPRRRADGRRPAARKGGAPTFIVWALKDPDDGNLDRIQIVKGWTKDTKLYESVYDVAWSDGRKLDPRTGKVPAIRSTVDIKNASYTNTVGAVELKKVWRDPDFDPSLHAFYYVRVLQIPTPRWSTYDAKKLGIAPPKRVSPIVQERAWGSPIWYTPSAAQARVSKPGYRLAELSQRRPKPALKMTNRDLLNIAAGQ